MTESRRRRWGRRLVRLAAVLVAARLALAILLPWILDLLAGSLGLSAQYRSASLSLSGLSLRLEDLVLRDAEDPQGAPILAAHEIVFDASARRLLRGEFVVVDAVVAGARILLRRGADGQWRLPAALRGGGTPATAEQEPGDGWPDRFDLPIEIRSARLHDVRISYEDDSLSSQERGEVAIDLEATNLGSAEAPGSIDLRLHSPDWIDDLWLRAATTTQADNLVLTWQAAARGALPAHLRETLAEPGRGTLAFGVDLAGELRCGATGPSPRAVTLALNCKLDARLGGRPALAFAASAGPSRATPAGWELPFGASLQGEDLVDDLRLAEGTLVASGDAARLATEFTCRGLSLSLLRPWLESRGVSLPPQGLDATAALHAERTVSDGAPVLALRLEGLQAGTADDRVTLARVAIDGLRAADGRTSIETIDVSGPSVAVTTPKDGGLAVAGVTLRPLPASAAASAPGTSAASTPGSFAWPDLLVRRFEWSNFEFRFRDESLPEPSEFAGAASLRGEGFGLGRELPPGSLSATLRIADAIGEVRADVTTKPSADGLGAEVQVAASGITAHSLAPWLQRAGITPALRDGSFRMTASTDVRASGDTLVGNLRMGSLRLEDGGEVLLGLRRLELQDLRRSASELHLGTLSVDEPFVAVNLEADRSLRTLGLRFGPAPAAATAAAASDAPAAAAGPAPTHGPWALRSGVVKWTNEARPEVGSVAIATDVRIAPDSSGERGVTCEADLRAGPGIADLSLRASVQAGADATIVEAELRGSSLRGAGISSLMPAGIACTLQDGVLQAKLRGEFGGGSAQALRLRAEGIVLADQGHELLAVDAAELDAPHLGSDLVHIATARIRGVRAVTARTAEGLHVPGVCFGAPADQPAPVDATTANPSREAPAARLPALRVDDLDLQLERLVFSERLQEDGEALLADFRIQLTEPWVWDAGVRSPAAKVRMSGTAKPLCGSIDVDAEFAPFELAPTADLKVRLSGIDTTALTRIAPSLAGRVDGYVTDAEFIAEIHARLDLRRRDPRSFDFSQAFGGELLLEGVTLRTPAGERLFGVETVAVDVRAFDPDSGDLLVRSLEIDAPALQITRTAAGLQLLGIRLAGPASDPDTQPSAAPEPAASADSGPEFAVDSLNLQAVTLDYVDETTTPPTTLPIREVDLSLEGVSTRALSNPEPITFSAVVRGGNVDLPRRVVRSSLVAGVVGSATATVLRPSDAPTQARALVEEIVVDGELQIYPAPKGNIAASIQAFELPALQGLARSRGFEIGDGLLDLDARVELRGGDGMLLLATPTFTWLSMSEPPGGPVSTYLRLPASLDTVLWLTRNEYDEHILPLRVEVSGENMTGAAIQSAAVETVTKAIGDAMASAHLRVAGMFTGTLGIGPSPDKAPATWAMDFAAGDPLPRSGSIDELVAVAAADPRMVVVLSHELGRGDLARAEQLANPPARRVEEAVARLHAERRVLYEQRILQAIDVAARLAAGDIQAARSRHARLAKLDDRIGSLERTLDDALRMLDGEGRRAIARRIRQGAVELAGGRLEAVRSLICDRIGDTTGQRVQVRRPRAVETEGLAEGGRVVARLRRRADLVEGKPVGRQDM